MKDHVREEQTVPWYLFGAACCRINCICHSTRASIPPLIFHITHSSQTTTLQTNKHTQHTGSLLAPKANHSNTTRRVHQLQLHRQTTPPSPPQPPQTQSKGDAVILLTSTESHTANSSPPSRCLPSRASPNTSTTLTQARARRTQATST